MGVYSSDERISFPTERLPELVLANHLQESAATQISDPQPASARPARRYDLDWLKIIATLAVFLFHTARFFDYGWWHVKNGSLDAGLTAFASFLLQWIMPLFFVISGASVRFALSRRTAAQFIRERTLRIFLPLVVGIILIVPPQVYLERVSRAEFVGTFLDFYPTYFNGWYGFGGNFAWMGLHLWYLLVLFLFSLLLLPVLRFLVTPQGAALISRVSVAWTSPIGVLVVPALPLILVEVAFDPAGAGAHLAGGWGMLTYALLFLYGTLLHIDERLEQALIVNRTGMFLAAVTTLPFLFWGEIWGTNFVYGTFAFTWFMALRTLNMWLWIVVLLSLGRRYLDRPNRALAYLSEAALPFYILHQTVILAVGYQLLNWTIPALPKYLVLSCASFLIIIVLYHFLVRPFTPLRLLFGLKAKV